MQCRTRSSIRRVQARLLPQAANPSLDMLSVIPLVLRTPEHHAMSTVRASTAQAIRASIGKLPKGTPFTGERFLKHGSRGAVDRTLSRLAGRGAIQRLARGVFVRPRTSRVVGTVLPDVLMVVQAIARHHGETVQVHGAEAARRTKLSPELPTAPVRSPACIRVSHHPAPHHGQDGQARVNRWRPIQPALVAGETLLRRPLVSRPVNIGESPR